MGYEFVQSGRTQFAVDWSVVRRLVRSHYTAYHQLNYGQEVTLSDSRWYNPLSWSLPDVAQVEVDWDAVRRHTDADTDGELRQMREEAAVNASGVAHRLESLVETAARNKETFVEWMGYIQTKNMRSINEAVDSYESNIEIAKFVRDTSADGLMVGATVMSGGAALAVMGGGSMLKGTGKFQDTGSIGAGVMEGVGSFAFAYVKLGKTFSFKQDMVLAIVQGGYKTGTELVGGATVAEAALSGGLKLTSPAVDRLFKIAPAKTLFDKVAVPVVITYGGENVASKFLSKVAAMLLQKRGIEKSGKKELLSLASSSNGDSRENGHSPQRGRMISEATLTNKYLLNLAFVNMEKGIGRGW